MSTGFSVEKFSSLRISVAGKEYGIRDCRVVSDRVIIALRAFELMIQTPDQILVKLLVISDTPKMEYFEVRKGSYFVENVIDIVLT